MHKFKSLLGYFTKFEILLWCFSVAALLLTYIFINTSNLLTLIASFIGVTSLIFNAKGNLIGQALMIIFSVFYGIISFNTAYYGEMITYLGMTAPMAIIALISWFNNPYKGRVSEVKVSNITLKEVVFMLIISVGVTILFTFVLKYFNTANLFFSTLSVTTSFIAAYLTFKRSPYFALAYALNDIVLIILWVLAAIKNITYISVIACFAVFLINDLYCFFSWIKMQRRQRKSI